MKAEISKGNLVVTIPIPKGDLQPSTSGKMLFLAHSGGWKPTVLTTDDGHAVTINLMAGIKNPDYSPDADAS